MKQRYSPLRAVLAAATMGTVMETSCTIGDPPDDPDCLFFCDRSTEKFQSPLLTDTPLPLSQTASGRPA